MSNLWNSDLHFKKRETRKHLIPFPKAVGYDSCPRSFPSVHLKHLIFKNGQIQQWAIQFDWGTYLLCKKSYTQMRLPFVLREAQEYRMEGSGVNTDVC